MRKIYYNEQGWVCQRFPYDIPVENENNYIEVNEDIFQMTMSCETYKAWRVVSGGLRMEQYEVIPVQINYEQELSEIDAWFASTDYIPNKVIVGEWDATDSRFTFYKQQRLIKRQRRDELVNLLK